MPLSSTVRLAALLATLVRSDISLSVGDAGIELSSNTSRNLSKDNSTGTDQTPGSTEHFEGPDKDFIIVENRLNIKCYKKEKNAPTGGGDSFVEMSRASDRKNKISRDGNPPGRSGESEERGEYDEEEWGDERDDRDSQAGLSGAEDSQAGLSGAEDRDDAIVANPDADLSAESHGEENESDGGESQAIVPSAAPDGGGGGGLVKSKKLPLEEADCPDHEATQGEDKVQCDQLTPLVPGVSVGPVPVRGPDQDRYVVPGPPPSALLYEVNCEDNKKTVEALIIKAQTRIKEAEDAIEAVKAEEVKLNQLIDVEKKKADGSVAALAKIKAALEALVGPPNPAGVENFIEAIKTDKIFLPAAAA